MGEGSNRGGSASYTVNVPPPNGPTFRGAVTIGVPGAGASTPPAGYHLDVTVFLAGGPAPVAAQTVHADGQEVFAVLLPDLAAGNYDIKVKSNHTLSRKKAGVALPQAAGAPPLSFGTLKTGDLNGDDAIMGADYSVLVTNFGGSGPEVAAAAIALSSRDVLSPVSLRLGEMPKAISAGDLFTVEVLLEAGEQPVDAVDVFLSFRPELLQVVDEAGAAVPQGARMGRLGAQPGETLPMLLRSGVDTEAGRMAFTLGRGPDDEPALGRIAVAKVRFKALSEVSAGLLPYFLERNDSRMSAAYYRGEQLTER